MGIRFLCPNGHRLNVKTQLAGKRGICPQCGVSVQIPEAEPAMGRGSGVASRPAPEPLTPPTPPARYVEAGTVPPSPLPSARWFLLPHTGDPIGPVSSETLGQWIAEGRVTQESWLWRESWPAWRQGLEGFWESHPASSRPSVAASGPTISSEPSTMSVEAVPTFAPRAVPVAEERAIATGVPGPRLAQARRRQRRRQLTVAMLVVVCLLAAGLGVVLLS